MFILYDRFLKIDHEFIEQIRKGDSNKVLCVVHGVYKVEKDAEIKHETDITSDLQVDGKVYIALN